MNVDEEYKAFLKAHWGDEMPIWVFCPICEDVLDGEGAFNGFGKRNCSDCDYEYRQEGSYASLVTIKGERFGLDDMFSDSEEMHKRIAELKECLKR